QHAVAPDALVAVPQEPLDPGHDHGPAEPLLDPLPDLPDFVFAQHGVVSVCSLSEVKAKLNRIDGSADGRASSARAGAWAGRAQGRRAPLARLDPQRVLDLENEHLPVAARAGVEGVVEGLQDLLDLGIAADDLDPKVADEVDTRMAAVLRVV